MNKKGFTLIELLSVIVLIGLILGIATTGVIRGQKKAKEKTLATKVKNIEKAAILYGQDHKEDFILITNDKCGDNNYKYCCDDNKTAKKNCYYYNKNVTVETLLGNDDTDSYINADEEKDGKKYIVDPTNKSNYLNNKKIIIYKKYGRIYAVYDKESKISDNNEEPSNNEKCKLPKNEVVLDLINKISKQEITLSDFQFKDKNEIFDILYYYLWNDNEFPVAVNETTYDFKQYCSDKDALKNAIDNDPPVIIDLDTFEVVDEKDLKLYVAKENKQIFNQGDNEFYLPKNQKYAVFDINLDLKYLGLSDEEIFKKMEDDNSFTLLQNIIDNDFYVNNQTSDKSIKEMYKNSNINNFVLKISDKAGNSKEYEKILKIIEIPYCYLVPIDGKAFSLSYIKDENNKFVTCIPSDNYKINLYFAKNTNSGYEYIDSKNLTAGDYYIYSSYKMKDESLNKMFENLSNSFVTLNWAQISIYNDGYNSTGKEDYDKSYTPPSSKDFCASYPDRCTQDFYEWLYPDGYFGY